MNERIRQLKQQAKDFYLLQEDLDCSTKQLHELVEAKFAELIVRECVQAVKNVGGYNEDYHMNAIKKYFGVEE
jgi:hypothetical protein